MTDLDSLLANPEEVQLSSETRKSHVTELLRSLSLRDDTAQGIVDLEPAVVYTGESHRRRSLVMAGLAAASVVGVATASWLLAGPTAPTTVAPGAGAVTTAASSSPAADEKKVQKDAYPSGSSILYLPKAAQVLAATLGISQQRANDAAQQLAALADAHDGKLDPDTPGFAEVAQSLGIGADRLEQALTTVKKAMTPAEVAASASKNAGSETVDPSMAAAKSAAATDGKPAKASGQQDLLGTPQAVTQLASKLGVSPAKATQIVDKLKQLDDIVPDSPAFAAIANSAGVSTDHLQQALVQLKTSH